MFLNYAALVLMIFGALVCFYLIIAIHDIPYEIAKGRSHPHQDAIHVAGWVSLMTLHVIWPFLWIWATLYREDRGWGFGAGAAPADPRLDQLAQQLSELQARLDALQAPPPAPAEPLAAVPAEPTPKPEA